MGFCYQTLEFISFNHFNSLNPILLTALDNENLLTNDHDELVEEINMLMFTMSLYLVLIAIWTIQNYCLRQKYDQVVYGKGNYNKCTSFLLTICCEKCSLAQMNTHLHN